MQLSEYQFISVSSLNRAGFSYHHRKRLKEHQQRNGFFSEFGFGEPIIREFRIFSLRKTNYSLSASHRFSKKVQKYGKQDVLFASSYYFTHFMNKIFGKFTHFLDKIFDSFTHFMFLTGTP